MTDLKIDPLFNHVTQSITCGKTTLHLTVSKCTDIWFNKPGDKVKQYLYRSITGPEGSSRFRLPDFETVCTQRWQGCQPYAQATFDPCEIFLVLISV
jgi:hypothetical protein